MSNGLVKLKNFIFDVLTLSYPRYRLITILIILFLLFVIPVSFLESMPNLSICSHVFGKYCYSAGITRGVASLLKGNLFQALNYNILSFPVLFALLLLVLYDSFSFFQIFYMQKGYGDIYKLDKKIAGYLGYKGLKDKIGYILERLNKIKEYT